jgi:hypothetical protein
MKSVDGPPTASMYQSGVVEYYSREHVFHSHETDERGRAIFSKQISRRKLLDFFADSQVARRRSRLVVKHITGPVSSPAWS